MNWRILNKIKHNPEPAMVAGLALAAQVFHAQAVFYWSGHSLGPIGVFNSWLYAVAVEFAVFFFVLRGWGWVSWGFAMASIGVNVAYYTIAHQAEHGWAFMFQSAMLPQTWFMWLLAIVLPVAVAAFSHAADGHETGQDAQDGLQWSFGWFKALKDRIVSQAAHTAPTEDARVMDDWREELAQEAAAKDYDQLWAADLDTVDLDTVGLGPVVKDMDLDKVDQEILKTLTLKGPSTKAQVADAVGMTAQAMDRKKSGKRTGRLVRLEEAGLVVQDPDSGKWSVRRQLADPQWVQSEPRNGGSVMLQKTDLAELSLNGTGPQ